MDSESIPIGRKWIAAVISCKWFWLAAFVAAWCALRVFWLTSDAGIPAMWEYGYNATDEGYYMGAAKDKYLWGAFCDFARGESFTYGYSAGTHWLSLLGYCIFGLSDWGFRVPFYLAYLIAWACSFMYIAKRSGAPTAFVLCTAVSCMPLVVAYERTAGNDILIAALSLVAFCLASGKGVWRIPASAAVIAYAALVKPSVWLLLPIVAASVLSERKTRSAWIDVGGFAVCAVLSICTWKLVALASVIPETSLHGMSASEIIRRTTTHNPLPSIFDVGQMLRGLSSFPRDPAFQFLGPAAAFVSAVPLAMAARSVLRRKFTWRLLLYLSVPAYVAGISVNNTMYTHYLHPVVVFLPILFSVIADDLEEDAQTSSDSWKYVLVIAGILCGGLSIVLLAASSSLVRPQTLTEVYSRIYNLPNRIVWSHTIGWLLPVAAVVTAATALLRGFGATLREGLLWFVVAFTGASVAFAGLPAVHLAPYMMKQAASSWMAPVCLTLFSFVAFHLAVFGLGATPARLTVVRWLLPATFALAFLVLPSWRSAASEMLRPGRHVYAAAARELERILPPDAVVIGERSSAVLMGSAIRTATTMPGCDPIPIVDSLLERNPKTPLFALADSQNAYNLQHFREHADKYGLQLLKTFKMPSFGNGSPADVHLCRIIPLKPNKR